MIKKLLWSTLLITWLLLGSFSYWVDSYTCSYKWIVNSVASQWISTTYYLTNCNNLWSYYDCSIFVDVSTTNWNCYQIWWFDLSYYDDINLSVELGWSNISFSKYNNNLDQLNGYTVCNPSRLMIQGRANSYVPDLPYTITSFPEYVLTNYSYTYTCPTCNTSSLENQLSSCQSTLSGCQSYLYDTENDLADALDEIDNLSWQLASCQNSSQCDYSWYILENEITSWYCETRFNLISPSDCPSSWSWDIQRSSFWVNNVQVMGWRNIYLFMPELFTWDYTYVEWDLQIDVENEWDPEYIEWIIENQTTLPNKTDLNNIITGIIPLFVPWLIIILFIYFIFRFIKKIF